MHHHPAGIPACSRWLSSAIPPEWNEKESTPEGVAAYRDAGKAAASPDRVHGAGTRCRGASVLIPVPVVGAFAPTTGYMLVTLRVVRRAWLTASWRSYWAFSTAIAEPEKENLPVLNRVLSDAISSGRSASFMRLKTAVSYER